MDSLTLLKTALHNELSQKGSSLQDLEKALTNIDKSAGIVDMVFCLEKINPCVKLSALEPVEALKNLGIALSAGSLAIGGTAGLGAILADRSIDSSDKKLKEKEDEIKRTQNMINELKRTYNV